MKLTPYAVEQKILGKTYTILLTFRKIARVDRAIKTANSRAGITTPLTAQMLLHQIAANLFNTGLGKISEAEGLASLQASLDLDTVFTILPVLIDQEVTADDVDKWLSEEDENGDQFSFFTIASWLAEAALVSNIVTLAAKEDGETIDPTYPPMIMRTLRGVPTDDDRDAIKMLTAKANA